MQLEELSELANRLGNKLKLGRGKKEAIIRDLKEKLGTKCPYCSKILTPNNCVYDHKTTLNSKKKRTDRNHDLDSWSNIHLICKPCNQFKSNLDHDEYLGFLDYLYKFPSAKKKFHERFRKERLSYKRR